jgi:predicted aspartyl protease
MADATQIVGLTTLLFLIPGCAVAPVQQRAATVENFGAQIEEIPLRRERSAYYVPVAVNGLPTMNFLLDTGASDVGLPAEIVSTLRHAGTLQPGDFVGDKSYTLADGRVVISPTFRIRELRVGEHVVRDALGSQSGTVPVLGVSFLSRFASWRIDNQRSALILLP